VLNGYYEIDVADAMSRIFTWLRYSASRHLTWQRNYNTQPRILSAAQERLTNAIAGAHGRTTGGWSGRGVRVGMRVRIGEAEDSHVSEEGTRRRS
jgi:hypothetical protein